MRSDGGERKKKEENKEKQATPENVHGKLKNPSVLFRSHVAKIEMLLTFHCSVCGRQLRLLMKDCRAYSRGHRSSRTPSRLCRRTHRARVKRAYNPGR
jgi:hypothetical protein